MIPSLLLLSAGVVATPVIVSEVKATREAGHLRVDVRADGGIDPEAAKTRIDQGNLYLFLGGAHVKADNRAWKLDEGVGEIRAHRHHTETELDVPLMGNGCAGPVELQGTPTGLTALVGCEGPAVAAPVRPTRVEAAKPGVEKPAIEIAAADAPTPRPVAAPSKKAPAAGEAVPAAPNAVNVGAGAPQATAEAAALKSLVALPPSHEDEAADDTAAPAPQEDKAKGATANDDKKGLADVEKAAPAPVPANGGAEKKAATPSIQAAAPAELPAQTASVAPSGMRAVGLPALFLAGLAVAAYFFARKKRAVGSTRRIQILETASLGPKRSLVIARVGEETLVLGASEAGITLLQSSDAAAGPKPAAAPVQPAAGTSAAELPVAAAKPQVDEGPNELDQSLIDALADVPEPDGIAPSPVRGSFRSIEGGLASLFGRKAAATAAARVEPKAATFDDLLEDSVEDQELRRKLAAGMSARVR